MAMLLADPPKSRAYADLGRRVKELREHAGLSQRALAEIAGISESYPGAIEMGRARPDPAILRQLAAALGTTYEDLATRAGFIREPEGDVSITVPRDKADTVRRLAEHPADILAWALDMIAATEHRLGRLSSERTPPPDPPADPEAGDDQPDQHPPPPPEDRPAP